MVNRALTNRINSSFFLFGARGTGKSTWLKTEFLSKREHLYIDLLDPNQEELYGKDPNRLIREAEALKKKSSWIVIDEVQKIPKLLDVVHHLIESRKTLFALTGSSARKLKRGHANMLAGRAFVFNLFPFTHRELGSAFDLNKVLQWGSLPQIFNLEDVVDKQRYLKAYTQVYLKEEILMEQVVRKLDPFRQFLEIAAQLNGEIINYSNVARDVGVDTVTAQSYFQILEDTLLGFALPAYHRSVRKRQRQNPKFYFLDTGIVRALHGTLGVDLAENNYGYGRAFEHFVILEIMRLNSYLEKDFRLSYLRTKDDAEIDLIIERPGRPTAFVEIKSTNQIDERSVRTLKTFAKDISGKAEFYCLSRDSSAQVIDGIRLLPWQKGIDELFGSSKIERR